jgi:hypothetical protein
LFEVVTEVVSKSLSVLNKRIDTKFPFKVVIRSKGHGPFQASLTVPPTVGRSEFIPILPPIKKESRYLSRLPYDRSSSLMRLAQQFSALKGFDNAGRFVIKLAIGL